MDSDHGFRKVRTLNLEVTAQLLLRKKKEANKRARASFAVGAYDTKR